MPGLLPRIPRKRVFLVAGVLLSLAAFLAFLYWPRPISSPESAMAACRMSFIRKEFLHISPRQWLEILSTSESDWTLVPNHQMAEVPIKDEILHRLLRDLDSNQSIHFTYGSLNDLARCHERMWGVANVGDGLTGSFVAYVLRERDGSLVVAYNFAGE